MKRKHKSFNIWDEFNKAPSIDVNKKYSLAEVKELKLPENFRRGFYEYFLLRYKYPRKWKKLESSYYYKYLSDGDMFMCNPRRATLITLKD